MKRFLKITLVLVSILGATFFCEGKHRTVVHIPSKIEDLQRKIESVYFALEGLVRQNSIRFGNGIEEARSLIHNVRIAVEGSRMAMEMRDPGGVQNALSIVEGAISRLLEIARENRVVDTERIRSRLMDAVRNDVGLI
jgi:hypothetical protein